MKIVIQNLQKGKRDVTIDEQKDFASKQFESSNIKFLSEYSNWLFILLTTFYEMFFFRIDEINSVNFPRFENLIILKKSNNTINTPIAISEIGKKEEIKN